MTLPVAIQSPGEIMEAVMIKGDLAQLKPEERAKYYSRVCESIGLNPLTKPFEYITLNGKLTLYARKDAADQLRKLYGVSVVEMVESREEGLVIVTVKVRDQTGRTDMAKGAVTLKGLQGEALANAFMKCETKAKRRATLSICGLGFLDETEVDTIPNAHTPRLPKKDARDIYSRLQAEVDQAADIEDWLLKNEGRMQVLPEDWENILRLRIQERQHTPPPEPEATEIWTDDGETPPEWQGGKWDALGPVKQAGILCSDEGFWKFLTDQVEAGLVCSSAENAATFVREFCSVASRKELATNQKSRVLWNQLVAQYRMWQREPEVMPPTTPASDAAGRQAAPSSQPQGGAADIPSAADYHATWRGYIRDATRADQLGTRWNADKGLHKQIEWTDEHPYESLKSDVLKAIEQMRAPA